MIAVTNADNVDQYHKLLYVLRVGGFDIFWPIATACAEACSPQAEESKNVRHRLRVRLGRFSEDQRADPLVSMWEIYFCL